jgi:hypothetical protein
VYQPTRVLQSVADLVEEVKSGRLTNRAGTPANGRPHANGRKPGVRHQTDVVVIRKPRPAMTR